MPKLGMEPIRRAALIDATIAEIGEAGTLDITVSRIAKRAGVSSGLAHHYFGGKDQILLAAMRHILREYGKEVNARLKAAHGPRARLDAIVEGSFAPLNFQPATLSAWLNFYVLALSSREARRLYRIYTSRLRSNLRYALRPLVGERANDIAERLGALIDGVYLRHGLSDNVPDGAEAVRQIMADIASDLK